MAEVKVPFFLRSLVLTERKKLGLDENNLSKDRDDDKIVDLLQASKILDKRLGISEEENNFVRNNGRFLSNDENSLNAWYCKVELKGCNRGKLHNQHVLIKDNLSIAGMPLMNGSNLIEGLVSEHDATVVTRILENGGTIKGKAHCENLCVSGSSFTNSCGPVLNPHNQSHTSGGSSSGVCTLISSKECKFGIGTDSGGSIRIPASWTGCCGMKPTYGLVPLSGMMNYDMTLDHIGPITETISDNSLLLEVIASQHNYDEYRRIPPSLSLNFSHGINLNDLSKVRIGLLKEGFNHKTSEELVDKLVKMASLKFEKLGAKLQEISIPDHYLGMKLSCGIGTEGFYKTIFEDFCCLRGFRGYRGENIYQNLSKIQKNANQLPSTAKLEIIMGKFLWNKEHGRVYGKSQNYKKIIKSSFENALKEFDILVMPTMPFTAPSIPKIKCDFDTYVLRTSSNDCNNAVFNMIGNPALTFPVGKIDSLPVGMLMVSRDFNENLLYQVAYAWEQRFNWKIFE